jgi:molybdate transport system substrate-binding protein
VRRLVALALAAALLAGGCGGDDGAGDDSGRLVVSAAASLTEALTACSRDFEGATVRLSFAGSDELAAQIRQGVEPDVFAAANTKLPDQLAAEGLLRRPRAFATNELVLAVPAGGEVDAVEDLAAGDVAVAVGAETVPVGAYTRTVLGRLPAATERAILANVRSEEPDVKGVVGKVSQGAVDAGFVYASDVTATEGRLEAIALPDELQPTVAYGAGVVAGAPNPEAAQRYLDGLVDGPCARALRDAGFGPPPGT